CTNNFEVVHQDEEENEKIFSRCLGEGLRYEIGAFVSMINGLKGYTANVTKEDSILLAEIMEKYIEEKINKKIVEIK
ncbi:MAG: glycerol-3-phosphate cytidylyltransferase, partial [Lachnospiraceae bacterium]|nr:glycerol-3-phosphate cytidylyltransferase [Lachnospiraceae bacterium]